MATAELASTAGLARAQSLEHDDSRHQPQAGSGAAAAPDFSQMFGELNASFAAHKTLPVEFRLQQLRRLEAALVARADEIIDAVASDLGRPKTEGLVGEVVSTIDEIRFAIKHLNTWVQPEPVPQPLQLRPGKSMIVKEPVGTVLIIAPWNFPINLSISPLVGAIAAGCCAVVKPSEVTPESARFVQSIMDAVLDPGCYRCVQGEVAETTALLKLRWDHVFYTGNGAVARVVMAAAAKHLTPVTLELGGKSPVIVDESANLEVSARRILHGKFFNNGQICVAPDYILCVNGHKGGKSKGKGKGQGKGEGKGDRLQDRLQAALQKQLATMFGADPSASRSYGRIVNERHWERVVGLLKEAEDLDAVTTLAGGSSPASPASPADQKQRYIPPTLLADVPADARIMQEEIFGPVLPILGVDDVDEAVNFVNSRDKPLALYVYSGDESVAKHVIDHTSAGGSCINDNVVHLSNINLPFGGVGPSGTGAYHGKHSFDVFTHSRSVMYRGTWLDIKARYPPYDEDGVGGLKKLLVGPLLPPGVKNAAMVLLAVGVGMKLRSRL